MPDTVRDALQRARTAIDDAFALVDTTPPPDPHGTPATPTGLRATSTPASLRLDVDPDPAASQWRWRDELDRVSPIKDLTTEPHTIRSAMKPTSRPRRYSVQAGDTAGGWSAWSAPLDVAPTGGSTPTPNPPPQPGGQKPTDVLPELKTWTVTTTTGKQGSPFNDYLTGKDIPGVFYVRDDGGVMFHATVDGFHTPNSKRCRVEGRQMADANWTKAAWNGSDPHTLEADLWASTAGLQKRKRVSALQIHDGADDVIQVVADAELGLAVLSDDGHTVNVLDPDYRDEQRFTCRIETGAGKIRVTYNDTKTVELAKTGSGWYFKAGAYNQASMAEHGEPPTAFAEVCIYKLKATGVAA